MAVALWLASMATPGTPASDVCLTTFDGFLKPECQKLFELSRILGVLRTCTLFFGARQHAAACSGTVARAGNRCLS
jgi:hypothetical protein